MTKEAVLIIFALSLIIVFMFGINVGKRIERGFNTPPTPTITQIPSPTATATPSPSLSIHPSISPLLTPSSQVQGTSVYNDKTCGFSIMYPSNYLHQTSENQQGKIFFDPDDSSKSMAFTCADKIPRPPVPSEDIESVTIDGQPATIYHNAKDPSGIPSEILIIKHPVSKQEIIILGPKKVFQQALVSFKFI